MKTDHIKKRNMIMQIVLMVVTLGIYAIYWYYSTLSELHTANNKNEGALLWTIMALIPLANLFDYWHYASEFSEFNGGKYPIIVVFIAWVVFSPLVWLLVQLDLNKAADGGVP